MVKSKIQVGQWCFPLTIHKIKNLPLKNAVILGFGLAFWLISNSWVMVYGTEIAYS